MRNILTIALLFAIVHSGIFAQNAESIIAEIKKDFSIESSFQASFKYILQNPESEDIIQSGIFLGHGEKFNLSMEDQSIISNGIELYVHLIKEKEVQITSLLEENGGMIFTPGKMLDQYTSDDYTPNYIGVSSENGIKIEQIEFLPIDKKQDVFKVRITVRNDNKQLMRIKSFSKDGSRQILELSNLSTDIKSIDSKFAFNPNDYPGVHVEDLR